MNYKRLNVTTIVGTRPEIIRLSEVMKRLDKAEAIDHQIIHTGQNYDFELNEIFYKDLGLRKPDIYLDAAQGSASETIGNIIGKVDQIFRENRPDALLVLGDTNSCLSAIPAKKLHVPIFHMEAGNRCFDQRVPEETNRKIVDHISDINLCYSDIAREYLLREGLSPDRVIKTGSPMYEVLHQYLDKINDSEILKALDLEKHKYFLVSAHREENIAPDESFFGFVDVMNRLAETYKYPIIISTHPRTRKRIDNAGVEFNDLVRLMKPMSFTDYNHLQMNSFITLSDSGTISEESSILNFRAVNIRQAHERPEAMEEASVMMTGFNPDRIMQACSILQSQGRGEMRTLRQVSDYSMPNVSEKVLRIIVSYTDYIKRVVYGK